ncbi:MAG: hypothetical protein HY706_13615 [Candidatus Hydrogenedentes bacterium]|nr:hypothetical protein [Candidatus Hydrogenedentota bacterium]
MPSVTADCDACGRHFSAAAIPGDRCACPNCGKEWTIPDDTGIFTKCIFCDCPKFYVQKDFNQTLGCLILLVGIILVPWTYGLSLPLLWGLDLLMRRRTPNMGVCYRCRNEFRGFRIPEKLRDFHHFTAEQFEKKPPSASVE